MYILLYTVFSTYMSVRFCQVSDSFNYIIYYTRIQMEINVGKITISRYNAYK